MTINNILRNLKPKATTKWVRYHNQNLRNLLPESVQRFPAKQFYILNDNTYDLYGWCGNYLIDIFQTTQKNITFELLPIKYREHIKKMFDNLKIRGILILCYCPNNKLFHNVIRYELFNSVRFTYNHIIDHTWIRASDTKNYMMNDPVLDYFHAQEQKRKIIHIKKPLQLKNKQVKEVKEVKEHESKTCGKRTREELDDNTYRMQLGIEFESQIIDSLIKKYPESFVKVCESFETRNIENFKKTIEYIKNKVPIIYQAVLHDPQELLYGCADLLVRCDWLNKLSPNIDYKRLRFTKFNSHYVVLDIKFNRLAFRNKNNSLRDKGLMRAFKSQLCIYNFILAKIQGYDPGVAYIIGRGWKRCWVCNKCNHVESSNEPFDKFGLVNIKDEDAYILEKTKEAIAWKRKCQNEEMTLEPPSSNKLYPNMKNRYSYPFNAQKQELANKIGEITSLAHVRVEHRNNAINNGINSLYNKDLQAHHLNIKGKTSIIINNLIKGLHMDNLVYAPVSVPVNNVEIFLDFETIYDFKSDETFPYMLGIGIMLNKKKKWIYTNVLCESLKEEDKKKFIDNIFNKLNCIKKQYNQPKLNCFSWSNVELFLINREFKKNNLNLNLEWLDLLKFCKDNGILFKGIKSYGLKEIGKIIFEAGLTTIFWNKQDNGLVRASQFYSGNEKTWDPSQIIEYNEIDCRMMAEILALIRTNAR